jgi:hypothetical protein
MKLPAHNFSAALRHGLLVLGFSLPVLLPAQAVFYGIDTSSTLYSIDALTQTATSIGSPGFMEGLALSPGGQLYGTDSSGFLYSIDTTTGVATSVGSTGMGDIEALAFVGSTLVGASFTGSTLFSIDTSTAVTTNITTFSALSGATRAMTAIDSNTVLIAADGAPNSLYSVNVSTGATTFVGSMAMTGQFLAMGLAGNGILYGFGNAGEEWQIDPNTGAITLLGNTGSQFWLDATTQAIPEPSTWALMISGAATLLLGAARRRTG